MTKPLCIKEVPHEIFFLFALFVIALPGCTTLDTEQILRSMYNLEQSGVSQFDGAKYVGVKNIPCYGET